MKSAKKECKKQTAHFVGKHFAGVLDGWIHVQITTGTNIMEAVIFKWGFACVTVFPLENLYAA